MARAARVVAPEVPPRANAVVGEVGVAEVAVEQVEQRTQPLDAQHGVAGGGRAEVVVDERQARERHAGRRHEALAQRGRALVAEAREGEAGAAARGGAEGAELRLGAVVQRAVQVGRIGCQALDARVVRVDDLPGLGVGVADRARRHRLLEVAVHAADDDARVAHRLQRVPGHRHLARRLRAELDVQARDRRRDGGVGLVPALGRGLRGARAREGREAEGAGHARGGEQAAAADFEIEVAIGRGGHGGGCASPWSDPLNAANVTGVQRVRVSRATAATTSGALQDARGKRPGA